MFEQDKSRLISRVEEIAQQNKRQVKEVIISILEKLLVKRLSEEGIGSIREELSYLFSNGLPGWKNLEIHPLMEELIIGLESNHESLDEALNELELWVID